MMISKHRLVLNLVDLQPSPDGDGVLLCTPGDPVPAEYEDWYRAWLETEEKSIPSSPEDKSERPKRRTKSHGHD